MLYRKEKSSKSNWPEAMANTNTVRYNLRYAFCLGTAPRLFFACSQRRGGAAMSKSKQFSFVPRYKKEHGGSLAVKRRRSRRPLNIKQSHHITLKSHHAIGSRSLFFHKKMILDLMKKHALKFNIKIYEYAIQGNHLHLLVKAQSREGLQNFFRVLAGHAAQRILEKVPFKPAPGGAPRNGPGCEKNRRKFWSFLVYSRVVTWGREFRLVAMYIQLNTLELFRVIAYQPRVKGKNSS